MSKPYSRSRIGGYFFLNYRPKDLTHPPTFTGRNPNGAIHVVTHLVKVVVSSAAEVETGSLFYNGKEARHIRTTLTGLGFPQGPTPIQTDKSTVCGTANDTVK